MLPALLSDERGLALIPEELLHGQGHTPRLLHEVGTSDLRRQCARACQWAGQTGGMKLLSGSLAAFKYLPASSGSLLPPKLVGSYESELHPTLKRIIACPYTRLVDVGSAEGHSCDILVECHDFLGRPISTELANRFRDTHTVEVIANTWTNPNERPFLRGLRPIQKFLAVWEGRPGLTPWLFVTSQSSRCVQDVRPAHAGGVTA